MPNPIGTYTPDDLFVGDFSYPEATKTWLSIPSGTLPRGTIVTAAGAGMATTGTPFGILAENADASAGPIQAVVYTSGIFNINKVLLANGTPVSAAADIAALRAINLIVKKPVAYPAA